MFRLNDRGLANRGDKRDDAAPGCSSPRATSSSSGPSTPGAARTLALADGDRMPAVAERLIAAGSDVFVGR